MSYLAPTYHAQVLAFERFLARRAALLAEVLQEAQEQRQASGRTTTLLLLSTGEYELCLDAEEQEASPSTTISLPFLATDNVETLIGNLTTRFLVQLGEHLSRIWKRVYLQGGDALAPLSSDHLARRPPVTEGVARMFQEDRSQSPANDLFRHEELGGYLVILEAILTLTSARSRPAALCLPVTEQMEAIRELALSALEGRNPHLSIAALASIRGEPDAGTRPLETGETGRGKPAEHPSRLEAGQLHGWPFQDILQRLVDSGIARTTGRMMGEDKPIYEWTLYGRQACQRFANTTPMAWAAAIYARSEPHCVACGRDMHRKRGSVRHVDGKRHLCKGCVILYAMDEDGQPHALPLS